MRDNFMLGGIAALLVYTLRTSHMRSWSIYSWVTAIAAVWSALLLMKRRHESNDS